MKQLFLLFITISMFFNTNAEVVKKSYHNKYDTSKVNKISINNSRGDIKVKAWKKNYIDVKVTISVSNSKREKAKDIVDKIDIKIDSLNKIISYETMFAEGFTFNKIVTGLFSSTKIKILYELSVPENQKFDLINKKGDITLSDSYKGIVNVNLSKGKLILNKLNSKSKINVSFGKVEINSITECDCHFDNCNEVRIKEAKKMKISSNHSFMNIASCSNIQISSKRGDIYLGEVDKLRVKSSFTDYEIKDVSEALELDLFFGSANIRNINKMFSSVDVKTNRGKLGLTFQEGSTYDVYILHNKSTKLDLPSDMKLHKRKTAKKRTYISEGLYGKKNNFGSKVNIEAKSCKMYIQ